MGGDMKTRGEHKMASNVCGAGPRPVSVTVVIEDDHGAGSFRLGSNSHSGGVPIAQEFVLKFDNNQAGTYSDGFLISFELPDDQGKNGDWTFADEAIWVKWLDKHGACPRNAQDHQDGILKNPTLSQDKRTLTVENANDKERYFGFALRFKNTGNGRQLTYDPIGDNRNGNSGGI